MYNFLFLAVTRKYAFPLRPLANQKPVSFPTFIPKQIWAAASHMKWQRTPFPTPIRKNLNSLSEYISSKIKTQVQRKKHTISPGTLFTSVPSCHTSSRPSRKPSCTSWLAALPQVEPHLFPLDLMQPPHPHPCQQSDYHAVPFQHQSHLWLHHHRSADHLRVTKLPYIPIIIDG